MEKKQKTRYHKESGIVLNYCEIKIDKPTKKVTYTHKQVTVVCSDNDKYVVDGLYGGLKMLDKMKKHYNSNDAVNKLYVSEQRWNSKYLEDYLYARLYSTFSEKITKNRLKKGLFKYIQKECYFYSGLEHEIEMQLSNKINA